MEQGNIGAWKVSEGDKFSTGDVLLTIETDKAEIDVEAQDDGILGRIVEKDGSHEIKIGQVIALLSEEGDSASDLDAAFSDDSKREEAPTDEEAPKAPEPKKSEATDEGPASSTPAARVSPAEHELPKQYKGLLPSVVQLCVANGIEDPSSIKATGLKGLTKGDVLAYLGKVQDPRGSLPAEVAQGWTTLLDFKGTAAAGKAPEKSKEPVTPADIRQAIMSGLTRPMQPERDIEPLAVPNFDSVLRDYLRTPSAPKELPSPSRVHSIAHTLPRGDALRTVLEA